MKSLNERISLQLQQAGASHNKQVVVVEGTGDIRFLTVMLDKPPFRKANPLAKHVLVEAGGKDAVFKILARYPAYHAIVDRDTWTDEECAEKKDEFPNLHILPRFCIENYIICPDELAKAIPDFKAVDKVNDMVPMGVRHGCLWRASQPLYDELMHSGFNKKLLIFPPPSKEKVAELVSTWQGILSQAHIEEKMEQIYQSVGSGDDGVLLRQFVHGKVFWNGVVEKLLAPHFPDADGERLKAAVFRCLNIPKDLEMFLMEVFHNAE